MFAQEEHGRKEQIDQPYGPSNLECWPGRQMLVVTHRIRVSSTGNVDRVKPERKPFSGRRKRTSPSSAFGKHGSDTSQHCSVPSERQYSIPLERS